MNTSSGFMFNCGKCPAQFYGLRELRKHHCKSLITTNELPKIVAAVVDVESNSTEVRNNFLDEKKDNKNTDDEEVEDKCPILQGVSEQSKKCKMCFQTFQDNHVFQKHISLCKGFWNKEIHKCPLCENEYPYKYSLKMHMEKHGGGVFRPLI